MKNKKLIVSSTLFILLIIIFVCTKSIINSNKNTDEITHFTILASPIENGSVDFTYEITWKVLDSSNVGPLSSAVIGIPNEYVSNITPISNNIQAISQINNTFLDVLFKESYKTGDEVTFKFSFNISNLAYVNAGKYTYEFTPCWFEDIDIDNMLIKWNSLNVLTADTKKLENGYYVWETSLKEGNKTKITVTYNTSTFINVVKTNPTSFSSDDYYSSDNSYDYAYSSSYDSASSGLVVAIVIFIFVIIFISCLLPGGSYSSHKGYGYYPRHRPMHRPPPPPPPYRPYRRPTPPPPPRPSSSRPSSHSSCAASSRCACACACAGGGRAGCSKKDFYGTKLNSKKIIDNLSK